MTNFNQAPEPKSDAPKVEEALPAGFIPTFRASSESVRRAKEAAEKHEEGNNDLPKPPKGKKARIGGVALGMG